LRVCEVCGLGQVGEYVTPGHIFTNYPYLSSVSESWLQHAAEYAATLQRDLGLGGGDLVIEVASNDGYLLRRFQELGVGVLGVEPAENVAEIARGHGIRTINAFFGIHQARKILDARGFPRLVVANNVLAHVPDLDDFVGGLSVLCGSDTTITVENPSFITLLEDTQFDTIYHEHFSYLSAHAVQSLVRRHGLNLFRVEKLPTHGGSYRYWLRREGQVPNEDSVDAMIEEELTRGLLKPSLWSDFANRSRSTIAGLREWFTERALRGDVVAAYGAAAKGNTLLNAAGTTSDEIVFVVDGSSEKQGKYLPGSRVPVVAPEELKRLKPSDVLVLPWNIAPEIVMRVAELAPDAHCWKAVPSMTRVSTW
jgi:hypothetical protein